MYYVYVHTVPNGKKYVGQTKEPLRRWNNGEGYDGNEPFYKDIELYGWNNILHEIVAEYEDENDALICEAVLISLLDAEKSSCGYNQSKIKETILKKYNCRKRVDLISLADRPPTKGNIFEQSGLPISACEEMINQWIFNKQRRKIVRDKLIDGLSFNEIAKKYKMSPRQAQNVLEEATRTLREHL